MILGIDLGNYNVKTSTGTMFKAKYTNKENLLESNSYLELDGTKYFIGDGELETKLNKTEKQNILPLLYTAILKSSNDVINSIVLGLPVLQYKQNKEKLKQFIEENNFAAVKFKGTNREILIDKIEVFPEGAGAYQSLDNKPDKTILIDIGGRTTNILLFEENKLIKYNSLSIGMISIYSEISLYLNSLYILDTKLESIESLLKQGLTIDNANVDFSFIKPILTTFIDMLMNELNLNYPIRTHKVLLSGGGSLMLGNALKNRLSGSIIIDNGLFANAYGFRKVGESLWLER
jgi:plasmid segregation protein ParM